MDDQQALAAVNHEIPIEKVQSLLRQGNSTSFIFSIKNRVGGLARALKVFQVDFIDCQDEEKCLFVFVAFRKENGINVVHIESRPSRRCNSEYEIFVDLEADRSRINESVQQLKRQVSCVRFDLNNLLDLTGSLEQNPEEDLTNINGNGDLDLPPPSPFLDKNGQPIKRKSKLTSKKNEWHQMTVIACV